MAVSSVSFNNTPQAGDDLFLSGGLTGTGITEDTLSKIVSLNVMANDLGGNAKKLYSIDDGIENDGVAGADLLVKDATGAISCSQGGARISITSDGKISYDTGGWSPEFKASLAQLGAGESAFDTFTYAIQLGNGTLSWATVHVEIAGSNDAPTVSVADLCGVVTEDATIPNLSDTGTITFDDLDLTDTHSVSVTAGANTLGGVLNAVITTPATGAGAGTVTWTYTVANSLADHLAQGQTVTETFTIRIADNHGGFIDQVVSVKIIGTNDGPQAVADMGQTTENQSVTIDVLANDTDLDDGHVLTLTAVSVDPGQGSVSIVGNQLRFDPGTDFDYLPAGTPTTVTVHYSMKDEFGATSSSTVEITVTGTNDAPHVTSGNTGTVAENADVSTIVYAASATDADAGDHIAWSLTGADAGAFTIDSSGNVRLNSSANYEVKSSYSINVVATDDGLLTDSKAVTINVTNVNEAPSVTSSATGTVAENAATSTVVYTATATDPDAGDHIAWSLTGADAAAFDIDADGNVTLKNSADYEAKSSYSINVVATDDGFLADSKAVTINVTNVNEAPSVTSGASGTVAENADVSTIVYTASAIDPDAGDHIAWSLTGADAAAFDIDTDGNVTLKSSADYEAKSSYSINVVATDDGFLTDSKAVTINVTNVNEAPSVSSGATGTVAENAPTSTIVYTASATDPDAGDHIAWSLTGADAGAFTIDGSGNVRLNSAADYEAKSSYSINVVATDDGLLTDSKAVTINVTNVNEAPSVTSGATGTVAENALTSTVVYTATATDPDAGDTVSWSLSGADAGAFNIDSAGKLRLNNPADYETKSSYSINVIATDVGGLSSSKAVTISVTDVNEAPPNVAPVAVDDSWVLSDTAIAINTITANWFTRNDTDADGNPLYVTAVSGLPAGLTAHYDGAGHLDYVSGTGAAAGSYTLTYTLSDGTATDSGSVSLTVLHTTSSGSENYTLDGNDFSYVDAQSAADTLTGDLSLNGNAGIDTFLGSAGDDILSGGAGDDILSGGPGADRLIGGAGADQLNGNNNADTFVYQATSDSTLAASDVISGFVSGTDRIDLSAIDAVPGGADNAFAFGGSNANTVANSVTFSESGGNTIIHIDNTGDTVADMQIVLTGTGLGLQASDFIL
jgi:VCBS repeat-containing protein